MATYISVEVLFLCLVVYYHDKAVVDRMRAEGVFDRQIVDEDESELRWLNGISVGQLGVKDRIRLIRDQISHGIEKFATMPEVAAWLDKVGGLVKLNEKLTGLSMGPKGWYQREQQRLRLEEGYELPPIGAPSLVLVDTATNYSGYAVEAHRTLLNRARHGEVDDMEENTTPNWALSWLDRDVSLPKWWKQIHPSQLPVNGKSKNSIFAKWRKMICGGPELGASPYVNLCVKYSEAQVDRNETCQELVRRFYQDPDRLWWRCVPIGGGRMTWVGGMIAKTGWVWMPLSKKANKAFNYWTDDGRNVIDGKINWAGSPRKTETYDKKSLVKGQQAIFTRKVGDKLEVRCDRIVDQSDGYMVATVAKKFFDPKEWGKERSRLTHQGWQSVLLRKGTYTAPEKEMEI
jgi:hypothetical protein